MANQGGSYTADKNGKNKKLVSRTQERSRDAKGVYTASVVYTKVPQAKPTTSPAPDNSQEVAD